MADKKVSELSAITNLSGDDLLLVVNDPSGTPTSNKVTVSNLFANVVPNVVHKGAVTNLANTNIFGTRLQITANTIFSGEVTYNADFSVDSLTVNDLTIIGTNGRLHANNTIQPDAIKLSMIDGIENYTLVANTSDRMQVANTRALIANETANTNLKVLAAQQEVQDLLANLVNTTIAGNNFVVTNDISVGNNLILTTQKDDPATSNAVVEGLDTGIIFYSNTHLYIVTDENTIKRVALSTF